MTRKKSPKDLDTDPELGDICIHIESGVEYVLYAIQEKTLDNGEKMVYPTFLMENAETGKLSEPFVIFGGMEMVAFVERGPRREPGEEPVRSLRVDYNADATTITAREGRLNG